MLRKIIKKKSNKRILSITAFILIMLSLIINFLSIEVKAAQFTEPESKTKKLANYPLYSELINNLKQQHPNWTFTIFFTGLDWNQVIKNETTAEHARNLVPADRTGEWLCAYCEANHRTYDEGRWKGASEIAVSYYMDPRNFLNENTIFQFENLGYNEELHTLEGVQTIIANCTYMQGDKITYIKPDGKTGTINKSYAQVILEAGQKYNISPYHLASRIVQEQGTTGSEMISGNYNSTYRGYYNFFNIGATGSNIMANGLSYAKSKGWNNPQKAINGGAEFLAEEYIQYGQTTLYFQKFDVVDDEEYGLYYHQYMQNVSAAKTEGETVKSTYVELGFVDSDNEVPFNFLIPVYENMPYSKCPYPGSQKIVTQNVEVTKITVNFRQEPSFSGTVLSQLPVGTKLLRIEIGSSNSGGSRWDKVVLDDGTKGYVVSTYLKQLDDISNCNEKAIASGKVNLRNGPGLTKTTVITTLTKGQAVTVMEKDKYNNIDGKNWYRVKLSNDQQGYVSANFFNIVTDGTDGNGNELVKVVCNGGLKIREKPGTNTNCLAVVPKGTILTRTQKEASTVEGYIWDKIVSGTGIVGYVARAGGNEANIEPIVQTTTEPQTPTTPTTPTEPTEPEEPIIEIPSNSKFKVEESKLICIPDLTVQEIKEICSDAVIKKGTTKVTTGKVGTGYTITTGGKTYTIIVKGDASGDGKISSTDLLKIQKHLLGVNKITDANILKASDVNEDGKISSTDLLKIQKHLLNVAKIQI